MHTGGDLLYDKSCVCGENVFRNAMEIAIGFIIKNLLPELYEQEFFLYDFLRQSYESMERKQRAGSRNDN